MTEDRYEWLGMSDLNIEVWLDLFHLEELGLVRIEHDEQGLMTVVPTLDEDDNPFLLGENNAR